MKKCYVVCNTCGKQVSNVVDSYLDEGMVIRAYVECPECTSKKVSFPIDIKHPQVIAFAKAMDEVLCKNDGKGGWSDCDIQYLRARLVEELGEYFRSVAINIDYQMSYGKQKPVASKELIDISNYCMMLWDRS